MMDIVKYKTVRFFKPALLAFALCIFFGNAGIAQQQPLFTQFMFNKLAFNPAFAGNDEHICLTAIHRNQWIGFEGSPTSQILSLNVPLRDQKLGLGFNLSQYKIGVTRMLNLEGSYAYRIPLGPGTFSMGLNLSARSFTIDFTDPRINTTDNITLDPALQQEKLNKQVYNVGTGFYFNTYDYFIGLSVPRLMAVDIDFDDTANRSEEVQHVYLMGGASFDLNDRMRLTPQALLRWVRNAPFDFDLNLSLAIEEKYIGGITYRAGGDEGSIGESVDFMFSVHVLPGLMLGMSYDVTLSDLRKYQNGSIELVASYCFGKNDDSSRFVNPRFY